MKDFKTLMIGFLLATCMFLLMGHNGFPITLLSMSMNPK